MEPGSEKKRQDVSRSKPDIRLRPKRDARARQGRPLPDPAEADPDEVLTSGWWLLPLGILGMVFWGGAIWFALF